MKNNNTMENLKGKGQRSLLKKKYSDLGFHSHLFLSLHLVLRTSSLFRYTVVDFFEEWLLGRTAASLRSVYSLLEPTKQLFLQAKHQWMETMQVTFFCTLKINKPAACGGQRLAPSSEQMKPRWVGDGTH